MRFSVFSRIQLFIVLIIGGLTIALAETAPPNATLACMTDNAKPEPVPFPVEVTVNGVRVTVTLMLKPGTAVTVDETKTTTEPKLPNSETSRR